jgi:hypothetical protein
MIYIIGPSHIHTDYTNIIQEDISNGLIFHNCILDPYIGIPNWSTTILIELTAHAAKKEHLCWIVSDYKFNNFEYSKILQKYNTNQPFLPTMGKRGNVSKEFMTPTHITLLGNHTLHIIDYIIAKFPNIKLIFWCLYKRTKANKNSSYPKHLWYDAIKERYKNNILDIDLYIYMQMILIIL